MEFQKSHEQKRDGICTGSYFNSFGHRFRTNFQNRNHAVYKQYFCRIKRITAGTVHHLKPRHLHWYNRRGSQIVESTMMMPILILIAVSFMWVTLFLHNVLVDRCKLQDQLLAESEESKLPIKIITETTETFTQARGLVDMNLHRTYKGRIYALSEGDIIRLGELTDVLE